LRIPRLRHHRVTDWEPYFENADGQNINGSQNVALHLGATAYLDCRIAMLSGKKVGVILLLYKDNAGFCLYALNKKLLNQSEPNFFQIIVDITEKVIG